MVSVVGYDTDIVEVKGAVQGDGTRLADLARRLLL